MRTSVIITTYNNPAALRKCLLGFSCQTHADFSVTIADDGSTDETRAVFDDPALAHLRIRHLWHEDRGFRRTLILNKAIATEEADYIIFCDGDCIPRNDFIAKHLKYARPGYFVSGSRVHVAAKVFSNFTDEDILENRAFDWRYLVGLDPELKPARFRLARDSFWEPLWNLLTWRFCVFHGSNSAAWRKDLLAVNGYDETFRWGSDDRDLGARLRNLGVRSRFLKFSLVQIHLKHAKPYIDPVASERNRRVFKDRLWGRDRTVKVTPGIDTCLSRS